jgi:hypothetical protein
MLLRRGISTGEKFPSVKVKQVKGRSTFEAHVYPSVYAHAGLRDRLFTGPWMFPHAFGYHHLPRHRWWGRM